MSLAEHVLHILVCAIALVGVALLVLLSYYLVLLIQGKWNKRDD